MEQLIAFWLFVAIGAAAVGGRSVAAKVLAWPFRFAGEIMRAMLGAAGQGARTVIATLWRGFVQLLADAHRHFYGRWPWATLLGYALVFSAAMVYIYHLR